MSSRLGLLAAPLLVALFAGVNVAPAEAATTTARGLMGRLTVSSEVGSSSYERAKFKHWVDSNGDGQNARAEVLIAESKVKPRFTTARHCAVAKGKWYSYYDGRTWTNPSDVDVDHV